VSLSRTCSSVRRYGWLAASTTGRIVAGVTGLAGGSYPNRAIRLVELVGYAGVSIESLHFGVAFA
jgi:hypothetical protein